MCHAPQAATIPQSWTRVLSRKINFSSSGGLLFLPRPGDQSGPRSVPERRAITAHLRWNSSHYRALSPEPLQGFQVGDGEGVNLRSSRSHSPGLCPGWDWNPGPPKDPTARAVGFNHCPGRSGQKLANISQYFIQFHG